MTAPKKVEVPISVFQDYFNYDPETGIISWEKIHKKNSRRKIGDVAGVISRKDNGTPYRIIKFFYSLYSAHRLAWALHYGKWPDSQIDHINGNGLDNRISNLRDVDGSTNLRNQKKNKHNTSGFTGVYWNKTESKWHASLRVNGKDKFLGQFTHIDDAVVARVAANKKYGFSDRHGIAT